MPRTNLTDQENRRDRFLTKERREAKGQSNPAGIASFAPNSENRKKFLSHSDFFRVCLPITGSNLHWHKDLLTATSTTDNEFTKTESSAR